jgi:hypothetical protein
MRKEFGASKIDSSGNRVFRLRGSATTMDADIIPATKYCFVTPTYQREGIELILDKPDGRRHFNYPDQHFDNGVAKNNRTGRRYKRAVRILKNIENKLVAEGSLAAFPSFLIECIAYNISDPVYDAIDDWRTLIKNICVEAWGYLSVMPEPIEGLRWTEVNGHKFLFGAHQRWNKQDAQDFIVKVFGAVTANA